MKLKSVGQIIATRVLDLMDGHTIKGKVFVKMGRPKPLPQTLGYYCPYEVRGLGSRRVFYIVGEDAFQAVQLAMKAIGAELHLLNRRLREGCLRWRGAPDGDQGFPLPWSTPVGRGSYGQWDEVIRSVGDLMKKREYAAATRAIDSFLASNPRRTLRAQALSFRSILKEKMGRSREAVDDLLRAHSLTRPGSFARYACELGLGTACERQRQFDEAKRWYWRGIKTCKNSTEIVSAGAALGSLLKLGVAPCDMSSRERLLLRGAILRSWNQMRIPGRPDLKNLAGVVATFREAASRPLPKRVGRARQRMS